MILFYFSDMTDKEIVPHSRAPHLDPPTHNHVDDPQAPLQTKKERHKGTGRDKPPNPIVIENHRINIRIGVTRVLMLEKGTPRQNEIDRDRLSR